MSLRIDRSRLLPATACGLAWRWTQPAHARFDREELGRVGCLPRELARRANREALAAFGREGLRSPPVAALRTLRVAESPGREPISRWLAGLVSRETGEVVAVWSADTALFLPWSLFVRRWDDFCYPGADDVAAFPESRAWVLGYRREDLFEWGVWRGP